MNIKFVLYYNINKHAHVKHQCTYNTMYKVNVKQSKHNYIWYIQLAMVGSYQQLHVSTIMVAIIRLYIPK